jgi:5'-3' exonuclease
MKDIVLIDHGSVYWAAWHSSVHEEVSAAHDRCVAHVRKIAGNTKAVAICCDSPKSNRRAKFPEYKANRPEKDHAAIEQLQRTKETLRRDGFLLWEVEGYEADDVIASAVKLALADPENGITVCTADKDLMQLVGPRVIWESTRVDLQLQVLGVQEKLGVPPAMVRDWLALVGDKSDNVPGVPGIGPVKAAALLNEFGNIETILERVQKNVTHKLFSPAIAAAFYDAQNLKNLAIARELVTLVDTLPVNFDEIFEERASQPLVAPTGEFDDEPAPASAPVPTPAPQQTPEPRTELVVAPQQPAPVTTLAPAQSSAPSAPALSAYEQQLQPQTLKAASILAETLFNSRLYQKLGNKEAIFAVILRGREMGLTALTSLDMFHVVEGRPTMTAHMLISRAKQHPDCKYFRYIGGDDTYAEYETWNRLNPEPTRLKYTIEQAKRAGVVKAGSNWEKRPAEMLRKTCGVQLARIEYPEALGGLYAQEELAA